MVVMGVGLGGQWGLGGGFRLLLLLLLDQWVSVVGLGLSGGVCVVILGGSVGFGWISGF